MAGERTRALNDALARITPDQRAAIVLFDVEGYDYAEIAEMTAVSLGTVKSRIHRGRLALRQVLEGRIELFRG
jgi:RNA polymerase sigma-70 factor (ECF subfamily)